MYIKYVKISEFVHRLSWMQSAGGAVFVLNEKQTAAANAYEVTLIVTFFKMMA